MDSFFTLFTFGSTETAVASARVEDVEINDEDKSSGSSSSCVIA